MIADLLLDWRPGLLAWFLTFALHSSVLLGTVWLVSRFVFRGMEAVQESLWKFSLIGALITSSLQLAFVVEPVGGNFVVCSAPASEVVSPASKALAARFVDPSVVARKPAAATAGSRDVFPLWAQWTLALLMGASLLGLGTHLSERTRLLWRLKTRTELSSPAIRALLATICERAGYRRQIRVSEHPDLKTPIAFGLIHPQICLPVGVVQELDEEELAGLLAHELAHLTAHDPLWLEGCSLLVALFPWQPLIRSARARFRELSEYRCDAVAAELTGHMPIARCLVEVARWMLKPGPSLAAALPGMSAVRGTGIKRRVERLLENKPRQVLGQHRFWLAPAFLLTLAGMSTALPGAGAYLADVRAPEEPVTSPKPHALLASIDALSKLDDDCAELAREFTQLQRGLAGVKLDAKGIGLVQALAAKLEDLDKRRIHLRRLILHSMFQEMLELQKQAGIPAKKEDERK